MLFMRMEFVILLMSLLGAYAAPAIDEEKNVQKEWCGGKPADIYFLLDSSSSIWKVDYVKQLRFLQDVVDIFEISQTETRVAVSAFSHYYQPFINFDSYDNKEDLKKAISRVPYLMGNTHTGDALKKVRERGFTNARQDVARMAIVITDGVSRDKKRTKQEATKLKSEGIFVFVIGVGKKVDEDELKAIASEPSDDFVFGVDEYNMLDSIRNTLAFKACTVEPVTQEPLPFMDQPVCGLRDKADMMFCFDSAATGSRKSKILYKFITELTDNFKMDDDSIRVGVTSRNCHEHDIHLDDFVGKDGFMAALKDLDFHGLAPVMNNMRKHAFKTSHGGRSEVKKVAVLFVDEDTVNMDSVIKEANEAKKDGIDVYVVSIGNVDVSVLQKIASEPVGRHVIKVSSYDYIPVLKEDFVNSVCQDL